MLERIQGRFEDRGGMKIGGHGQPVMHPLTFPASYYEPCSPQISQMAGNFRLPGINDLHKIADADFLLGNEMNDPKPSGISKNPK